MNWLSRRAIDKVWLRVRSVACRQRVDEQLDIELTFHLEQQIQENLAAGMSPDEAAFAARRAIGDIAQIKDRCRDTRSVGWITDLLGDIVYACRTFARAPVFAITIAGTLALGIGANTAVFSIADALLLKTLPLPEPDRLVKFLQPDGPGLEEYGDRFSVDDYFAMRDAAGPFARLVGETGAVPEGLIRRDGASSNYFSDLGVTPVLGRTFQADDGSSVGVLSYAFWRDQFNLDSHVMGRTLRVGKATFEIIGVARPGFYGLEPDARTDVWTLIQRRPHEHRVLRIIGRLNPGATALQVFGPLQELFHERMLTMVAHPPPDTPKPVIERLKQLTLKIEPAGKGFSALRVEYDKPLRIVLAIVALVLLIACLNAASLMMARAIARQREMAVRVSLGAGRWRLLRQLLTESLLLSIPAALLGVAIAHWTAPLLAPQLVLTIDGNLLAFTSIVCIAATLIFGLIPALRVSKLDVNSALRSASPQLSSGGARTSRVIVASQIAFSLVLLISSTQLVRTLCYLSTFDIGFDRRNVVLATVRFQGTDRGERLHREWERLLSGVSAMPEVESASLSTGSIFNAEHGEGAIRFPDGPANPQGLAGCLLFQASTNFFRSSGTVLIAGRDFGPHDFDEGTAPVAIVNDTFSRSYFHGASPIGKRFSNFEDDPPRWITVIGVVKDTRHGTLRSPMKPIAYLPYTWTRPDPVMSIIVRTRQDNLSLGVALRNVAAGVNPQFEIGQVTTQQKLLDDSLVRERLLAGISSVFALLALAMTAIGLYGIVNYTAARRIREIGIRLAVGAEPGHVVRMILREMCFTLTAGTFAGLLLSFGAVRWISFLLFGVRPQDSATLFSAIGILAAIALTSAWVPARRAARTDPVAALRVE
jgi:predicted permease